MLEEQGLPADLVSRQLLDGSPTDRVDGASAEFGNFIDSKGPVGSGKRLE